MINIKTNIPELDRDNANLIKAALILEELGNFPNPTAVDFYQQLLISDMPFEEHEDITLAAISIETMMSLDMIESDVEEPTVH